MPTDMCINIPYRHFSLISLLTLGLGDYKMPEWLWKQAANWHFFSGHPSFLSHSNQNLSPILSHEGYNPLKHWHIWQRKYFWACSLPYLISWFSAPVVSKIQHCSPPIFTKCFSKCKGIQKADFSRNRICTLKPMERLITLFSQRKLKTLGSHQALITYSASLLFSMVS